MNLTKSAIREIEANLSKGRSCEVSPLLGNMVKIVSRGGENADIDFSIPIHLTGVVRISSVVNGKLFPQSETLLERPIWLLGLKARKDQPTN